MDEVKATMVVKLSGPSQAWDCEEGMWAQGPNGL